MWNPFRRKLEERAIPNFWGRDLDYSAFLNVSGASVTSTSILGLSAAWSAVSLVSDSIATLPVDVFIEDGEQRIPVPAAERPRWLDNPGNDLSRIDMLGQVVTSLLIGGEAFVLTPRDAGQVQGLVVLDPELVQDDGEGGLTAMGQPLDPSELVQIRGLMLPGSKRGLGPVAYAREAFGSALATQTFGAAFFGNGAWTGAVIEVDGPLSEDGQKAIKAYVNGLHQGPRNAHKIGVLVDKAKMSRPLTFSAEDSQFLQTRDFQVADIARFFRVPPEMIGGKSTDSLTYATLEGRNTAFVTYALLHWIVRLEEALTALWHSEGGPEDGRIKLNVKGLLRGSTKERADVYALALDPAHGWMTRAEVRALEDLPPEEEAA